MPTRDVDRVQPAPEREYRPRQIWAGTLLLLVACLVGAVAVAMWTWWLGIVAGVLAVVGAALAWFGRILRDTHGTAPVAREWHELKDPEGTDTVGRDPGDMGRMAYDPYPEALPPPAEQTSEDKAQLWGLLVLLLGLWLLVDPYFLQYPNEVRSGVDGRWRDISTGVLLLLTGLWTARTARPNLFVLLAGVVAGLVLILITETTTVPTTAMRINELACGALAIVLIAGHSWYAHRFQTWLRHQPGETPHHKPH